MTTRESKLTQADWSLIPEHMRGAVERYVDDRVSPGGFLRALLENDLRGACEHADSINGSRIRDYVVFLYNYAPAGCWGSPEKVAAWLGSGGAS